MAQAGGQGGGQPQPPNVFNQASSSLQGATKGTVQGVMYQPQQVNTTGLGMGAPQQINTTGLGMGAAPQINTAMLPQAGTSNVTAGQLASTNLDPYMNPYENQVVGQTLQDLERARLMQANQLNAQATAANAFGGSRQALMQSELGRNFLDEAARTAGGLRQAGFQNAQQMGLADIGNSMQAQLANQQAGLSSSQFNAGQALQAQLANQQAGLNTGQFNAGQRLQAQLANQQAGMSAGQFNAGQALQAQLANQQAGLAGAGLRLGASNQLAELSNLGFGMGQSINDRMMQQGNMQQLLQQQLMNNAQNQFQGYTGAGAAGLGYMGSALGTTPQASTTTETRQPGLFDYLTLGANTYGAVKGAGALASLSDARLKTNITPVGYSNGHRLYRWQWRNAQHSHLPSVGVLAQEVMQTRPDAVVLGEDGHLRVRYDKLFTAQ
jgi:hypothetical protein